MFCCFRKIACCLVVKVYSSNRVYLLRLFISAEKFFVVVLVKRPKKICLVKFVLFKCAMKLKMLVRNVHKSGFVKKHRAEPVRSYRKPVRRRLNNRVCAAVLNHFVKLFADYRCFRCCLMFGVWQSFAAERILYS